MYEDKAKQKIAEAIEALEETVENMDKLSNQNESNWVSTYVDEYRTNTLELRKIIFDIRKIARKV